jgi:hypothetical protein
MFAKYTSAYDALFLVTAIMTFGVPKIAPDYRRQTAFLYLMPVCYGLVHTFRYKSNMFVFFDLVSSTQVIILLKLPKKTKTKKYWVAICFNGI